jgi:hypothetical protein
MDEQLLDEIVDLIDCGNVVYVRRDNHDLEYFPSPEHDVTGEHDYQTQQVLDLVDADPEAWIRIDPPDSRAGYQIMEAFAETLSHNHARRLLSDALASKKPFRNFRMAIESERLDEAWYAFQAAYLRVLVRDFF